MKRKRFIGIGVIALIMTGSTAAYGAIVESGVLTPKQEEVSQQLVTLPAPKVTYPVQVLEVISGPVKKTDLVVGPVFSSDPPTVGSIDWMAQEKAEKDKLRSDAARKQAELEAEAARVKAELEAEITRLEKIAEDTRTLNETLILVKNQIGITPWVFQGSSPRAWDCSGLVRWTYAHLDVDLRHSASSQRISGEFVTEPKIGDLVSFNHRGWRGSYHIGIYIGPDEMIHAGGKPGDRTEIRSISGWSKDNGNSEITYTRIIETNN
jgi:cell wall-associated NlpC family hydrolase